jgi:hypothetical protein
MQSKDFERHLRPRSASRAVYFAMYSKFDRFRFTERFELERAWPGWYERTIKCTNCEWPQRMWQEKPMPFDIDLVGSFPGCTTGTLPCPAVLVREDLFAVVSAYLPALAWGNCYVRTAEGRTLIPFWSCQPPRREWVNPWRGPGSRYRMCPVCARVYCHGFGRQALVAHELRDRPIVPDERGSLYICKELADDLKLTQRFSDLRLLKIPVLPEPLDDWTLPGDPGWAGVLRMKYPAGLGVMIQILGSDVEEQTIYRELQQRLKKALTGQDIGQIRRDRGSHGSCLFQVDGMSTGVLREAALRAISGWRVRARFYISLHQYHPDSDELIESFELSGLANPA